MLSASLGNSTSGSSQSRTARPSLATDMPGPMCGITRSNANLSD
jgi:hypothetical protein